MRKCMMRLYHEYTREDRPMTNPIDYVTVIEPVYEVTLFGTADLAPWQHLLQDEGLPIAPIDGRAALLLSVIDSKYMGMRFQEFSISVSVGQDRYFFPHAYNSIGLFALAERRMFRTPYYQGNIHIDQRHITLSHGRITVFEATLPPSVTKVSSADECWEISIHLPKHLRQTAAIPHYFHARLEGHTEHYPAESAAISIMPTVEDVALRRLKDSHFRLLEWRVRPTARHSKSKTYQQTR